MTRPEFSKLWRVPALPGVSFFKARFVQHAFSKHAHEEYAIGASESGVETFQCRGDRHWATPGSLILVNPEDLHDGHAVGDGYSYRMIYVAPEAFDQAGRENSASPRASAPLFRSPMIRDEPLAAAVGRIVCRAENSKGPDCLALEAELLQLLQRLLNRHGGRGHVEDTRLGRNQGVIRMACRFLEENFASNPTLTDLSAHCRVSRFALMRLFSRHVGMPPHTYTTHVRLRVARQLLLKGEPAASVAAAVGYVDQSHLTKRFRAAFGVTPGQFAAALA
jgi:AraC-like DNA-binding protein